MTELPRTPSWVRWALQRLVPPGEDQVIMDELRELHDHWSGEESSLVADRRYLRQLRQYPVRLLARRMVGGRARRMKRNPMVSDVVRDVRFGLRMLARRPGFTVLAVLTLALGLGSTTAVFSVFNGVLLHPLPYPQADRLVFVWSENSVQGWTRAYMSRPDIADVRRRADVDFVEGFAPNTFTLLLDGQATSVPGSFVTGGLLEGFGLVPVLGRDLRREENQPSAAPVVVIGHDLWQRQFGEDPHVLGSTLAIDEERYEVVGVAPPGFDFPDGAELWVAHRHPCFYARGCRNLLAVGRLTSGKNVTEAQSALEVLSASLRSEYPETNGQVAFRYERLLDTMVGDVRTGLWVLLGGVALMLLVVCANLANILLARAINRRREVAVRAALGASRQRVLGQLLVESLTVVAVGAAGGLVVAFGLVNAFKATMVGSFPRVEEVALDGRVVVVSLGLALGIAIVFGFSPAVHLARQSVAGALRGGSREGVSRRERGVRSWLLGAEVALSVVLLVGAGLLMRSLGRLYEVDLGFEHRDVVRFNLTAPPGNPDGAAAWVSLLTSVETAVAALPGVTDVGAVAGPPLGRGVSSGNVSVEGRPEPEPSEVTYASVHAATPAYFETLGLALLEGRPLGAQDGPGTLPVAVVSQQFARENFPGGDAVGGRFQVAVATGLGKTWTVVGVVRDTRSTLTGEPAAQVYVPLAQSLSSATFVQQDLVRLLSGVTVHVRGALPETRLIPEIRERIRSLDPRIRIADVETITQAVRQQSASTRHQLQLMGLFASLALALAAVGLYGVVSYLVAQRTREISIRLCMGARRWEIAAMVVRQGIFPAIAGTALGLGIARVGGRALESLLFGVTTTDATVFVVVALLTPVLSVAAILTPAWKAAMLDPAVALRTD